MRNRRAGREPSEILVFFQGSSEWLGGGFPKLLSIISDTYKASSWCMFPARLLGRWRCFTTSLKHILNSFSYHLGHLKLRIVSYLV
jgi:hypothetical protein